MPQQQHTHTQPFYGSMDFVRDNPGEPVPEETFTHSHLSWSSIIAYLLHLSTTIHGILPVQSTHLNDVTVFFHNLCPRAWEQIWIKPRLWLVGMAEGNAEGCKMALWCLWYGIGNNSIQCTRCQKWVHRKCRGIKGSIYKVMKTFVCRGCVNQVAGTGCTSVDTGANANLELVDNQG